MRDEGLGSGFSTRQPSDRFYQIANQSDGPVCSAVRGNHWLPTGALGAGDSAGCSAVVRGNHWLPTGVFGPGGSAATSGATIVRNSQ